MSVTDQRTLTTTSPATGTVYSTRLGVPPGQIPHYSHNPHLPVFFYGGWASSFAPYGFRHPVLVDPLHPGLDDNTGGWDLWETREHWFQAHKPPPDDIAAIEAIAKQVDPWDAKALGQSKTAFTIREGWDDGISYAVMLEGIRIQIDAYDGLRRLLYETGNRFIAEVSAQGDMIWGIHDPKTGAWDGKNWLGAAWMQAREEL